MRSTEKPALLYLCHRIPYPPNKGDKIRSYHLLRYLCEHYRVFLGAFVDDEEDWQFASVLESMCDQVKLIPLSPIKAKLKSLEGLIAGQSLSVPYYRNRKLSRWVNQTLVSNSIDRAVVFSSTMAQYVMNIDNSPRHKVLDMVDVDSDKWRQYAETKSWPLSWLYRREAECLLAYEKHIAEVFDFSFFVSEAEAQHFLDTHADGKNKIGYFNNGVDGKYFDPSQNYRNPYRENERVLVFTGAMDYWPNVDAVIWFVTQVFPVLRAENKSLCFYIVGRNPTKQVTELSAVTGVEVTGSVEDVRPYIQHALAAIAPMRIARGVQNKVLEAMAMEKVVLVSKMGLEGIHASNQSEVYLAESATDYVTIVDQLTPEQCLRVGKAAKQRVEQDFTWDNTLPIVKQQLEKNECL